MDIMTAAFLSIVIITIMATTITAMSGARARMLSKRRRFAGRAF